MLRLLNGVKVIVACLCLATLMACTKNDKPQIAAEQPATPGSQRDFLLNVGDRVHFLVDQSTLTVEAQETLRRQATWLRQYGNVTVQIEGHADERGTREYNIALSARRATATRQFLIAQGIQPGRIATIAYGKERPVALCDAESCFSQNRRAITLITGGAVSG